MGNEVSTARVNNNGDGSSEGRSLGAISLRLDNVPVYGHVQAVIHLISPNNEDDGDSSESGSSVVAYNEDDWSNMDINSMFLLILTFYAINQTR